MAKRKLNADTDRGEESSSMPVDRRKIKSANTREAIVVTAMKQFLDGGFSNTSLEKVAAEAGVTKPTVYSHFHSKAGLLEAVIHHYATRPVKVITGFLVPSSDPASDLIKFGDFFMSRVFEKDAVQFRRLAISESAAHPNVGAAYYKVGPGRLLGKLAEYFKTQTKQNRLNVTQPEQCAEHFVGSLIGLDLLRSETGQPLPSKAKRKQRCRATVEAFIVVYGVKS